MNSRKTIVLLAVIAAAASVQAQAQPASSGVNYRDTARINDVQVLTQRVNQPQQICNQVAAATPAPQKHGHGGAIIGGLAGGLLGHSVGKGSGKDVATAGAAVLGAMVGDHVQNQSDAATTTVTNVQQCYLVDNWVDRQVGAVVSYTWQGRSYTESLPYVPNYRAGDDVQLQVHTALGGRVPS